MSRVRRRSASSTPSSSASTSSTRSVPACAGAAGAIVVARTATAAGLSTSAAWSGHSLRRGFATETYRTGADPLRIARAGGWKDGFATLLGYIETVDRWQANPLTSVGL